MANDLSNIITFLGGKFDQLAAAVSAQGKKTDETAQRIITTNEQLIAAMDDLTENIEELKGFKSLLSETQKTIKNLPEVNLYPVISKLDAVRKSLTEKTDAQVIEAIHGLTAAFQGFLSSFKTEIKDTFKLDEKQFRELAASSRVGPTIVGGGGGGAMTATHAVMANVSITSADTEYSYAFRAGTVAFYIKLRAQNALMKFAWVSGESGTTYMTIPQNGMQSRPGIDFTGKTIYFQSPVAGGTAEIESYVS